METQPKKMSKYTIIMVILLCLGLLSCFKSCDSSSTASHSAAASGQVRCWYCSKVIYNDGKAIHCSHEYNNTYKCDYCGKSNVIK